MKNGYKRMDEQLARIFIVFMLTILFTAVSSLALAAKGGIPGKPGGGEETAGNNLSFPAITFTTNVSADWGPPTVPAFKTHYSYGCDGEETYDIYSYPNTSCVDNLMAPTAYYTAEECTAAVDEFGAIIDPPRPCAGRPIEDIFRIYWQKVDANNWSAAQDSETPPVAVDYLDWGDALEATSWNENSRIRVETQPYSSRIAGFDPVTTTCEQAALAAGLVPSEVCKVGFQMWHVSGQGTTEQWGVRATEAANSSSGETDSFNYDSPFQIINTGTAHLNIAKMGAGTAVCPTSGGGDEGTMLAVNAAPGTFAWDDTNKVWAGDEEIDVCTWLDAPYSVELSVGGKYVYGYNWAMRSVVLPAECLGVWSKSGWWRLTYYTTDDAVLFDDANALVTAPPAVSAEARPLPRTAETFIKSLAAAGEPTSEALYTPVIDTVNNLTYLDICILPKTKGGGSGPK